jgi:hypothetical protein
MNDRQPRENSFIWRVVVPETRPALQAARVERLCGSVTLWQYSSRLSSLRLYIW